MKLQPGHISKPGRRPSAALCIAIALLALTATAALPGPVQSAETANGKKIVLGKSGLPLPRFVSLSKRKVNLRKGPGLRYPIDWVYSRKELPVEIVAEFDTWRKIRDWEGTVGWVHKNMLQGRRTVMIQGETRDLRDSPAPSATVIARTEAGVLGQFIGCRSGWCRVEIAGYRGWLRSGDFFGAYPEEASE